MAITDVAGNVFSQIYGSEANKRDSGYFRLPVPITGASIGASNTYYFPARVAAYPAGVKLRVVSAVFTSGPATNTTNATDITVQVLNLTASNTNITTATALNTNAGLFCGATADWTPITLTAAAATSDRSTVAGMSATESTLNCAPSDILLVKVVTAAGAVLPAGGAVVITGKVIDQGASS